MKGQNLRIMLDNKVVAGSKSCNFHVSAQTEESSTKDSPDAWAEYEIVGNSWDCQVDALVSLYNREFQLDGTNTSTKSISSVTYYVNNISVQVKAGEKLHIEGISSLDGLAVLNAAKTNVLVFSSSSTLDYTNNGPLDMLVYVAKIQTNDPSNLDCQITSLSKNYTQSLLSAIEAGTVFAVKFAPMTGNTHDTQALGDFLSGNAVITDIQVNASNKQLTTYSCKLIGVGSLTQMVYVPQSV